MHNYDYTVVIPCLNEELTLAECILEAFGAAEQANYVVEVIVADNGSSDDSVKIAHENGARVVLVPLKGYGAALDAGIRAASSKMILMGDADCSYSFIEGVTLIEKLRDSNLDIVMGNRFTGTIESGAMPWHHKYVGNPALSLIGRVFFNIPIGDFHCGMRGFTREAFDKMGLGTAGMEFASEMVVKASSLKRDSAEVPVKLYKDGRGRSSHLNTWTDGWRHLRFLLLFSPRWLFFYPGLTFVFLGLLFSSLLLRSQLPFQSLRLDVHTLLYTSALILIGFQMIAFYLLSQAFARREGLYIQSGIDLNWFKLERGLLLAFAFLCFGVFLSLSALQIWEIQNFGPLNPQIVLRKVIPAVTAILLAFQVGTFSFFMSFLQLKRVG